MMIKCPIHFDKQLGDNAEGEMVFRVSVPTDFAHIGRKAIAHKQTIWVMLGPFEAQSDVMKAIEG